MAPARSPLVRPARRGAPRPTGILAPLTRRRFLGGVGAGGAVLLGGGVLAGCGTEGVDSSQPQPSASDRSDEDKTLVVSNWPLYIDETEDGGSFPTVEAFEQETGVSVTYNADINDNTEFFGKLRPQLSAGQATGRDIVVLTDWMAGRLISLGWVQQLDKANMPNVEANLLEALRNPGFDEDRAYSVPWQTGVTGIAYNAAETDEVRSMSELLSRPELAGRVTALSEMRDSVGLVMLDLGIDPADFTDDEFDEAVAVLQQATDSGHIRRFTGNDYTQDLANGTLAACVAWSGDVIQLQFENPDIRFVVPEAGLMLWSDNMLVPNLAAHKKNAELWMDHYYDPAVAAELAAWVNYISPVEGAREAMLEIDPELADNELIFPGEDFLAQTHVFRALSEEEDRGYEDKFQAVIGA